MKGDALKHALATHLAGIPVTRKEQDAALADAVDLALDFLFDVKRIACAVERLSRAVDNTGEDGGDLNVYVRAPSA